MTDSTPNTNGVIAAMLRENTGRHMLDSGDAYGRNWQNNQSTDFDAEPYATVETPSVYYGSLELDVTVSAFHWLTERLDYAPDWQAKFDAFAEEHDNEHWLQDMEVFAESVADDFQTVNTYNEDCHISQTLQFTVFEDDDAGDWIVALQVHGGCDVRGGYTAPKLFRCGGMDDEYSMFDFASPFLAMRLIRPEAKAGRQTELADMEPAPDTVVWFFDNYDGWQNDDGYGKLSDYDTTENALFRGLGVVYIDTASRTAYCPITGEPLTLD